VPVGTTRHRFAPLLEAGSGLTAGKDFNLSFSPERVSVGRVLRDLATYPKVVGGLTDACLTRAVETYASLGAEVATVSSLEAAEFVKVAEAVYRDVNIALANEFSKYADGHGISLREVVAAANTQPYSHIHQAGVGVGGHCIPVYPYFFMVDAADSRLVGTARNINDGMPAYTVDRLAALMGGLEGRRVMVLGLAFRADVSEASHSVAVPLIRELEARNAEVRVHDSVVGPAAVATAGYTWAEPGDGWAEGVVLQAAHHAYLGLRPEQLPGVSAVVDGRGALDAEAWRNAGVAFMYVGG
jgi:nucleotide sugar dehydrogenase